ncbi:hypothetical protein EIZ62_16145 [Streptomyces ficellus]|uniref:Uncharacterized protein n=1 Tax=Streptomyces ficellus TaxID=1977088 RepID=A0A6I6F6G6_9ACTN|nr:hypothetical protein EIZ62_16145 [Streptomyces ficellus]
MGASAGAGARPPAARPPAARPPAARPPAARPPAARPPATDRSPAERQRDRSRTAEAPDGRSLTTRADGRYRRDDSLSPAVFLLLLFLPAAALVVLASRRL